MPLGVAFELAALWLYIARREHNRENAPDVTHRGRLEFLEHETGLEPATPTLATWRSTN